MPSNCRCPEVGRGLVKTVIEAEAQGGRKRVQWGKVEEIGRHGVRKGVSPWGRVCISFQVKWKAVGWF